MDDQRQNVGDGSDVDVSENDADHETDEESETDPNILVPTYINELDANDIFALK